jgi:hypothetical protein
MRETQQKQKMWQAAVPKSHMVECQNQWIHLWECNVQQQDADYEESNETIISVINLVMA